MSVTIIDVSAAQGAIDWPRVAGCDGAIVKATEGNDYIDPQFPANFRGALAAGLLVGTYHFAHPDSVHESDPDAEASHYVHCVSVGWDRATPLLFALDIEEARRISAGPAFVSWCRKFIERVEALTGLTCWVYTGGPFFSEHSGSISAEDAAFFAARPLWLAAYVDNPAPYVALTPWRAVGCALHQWSGDIGPHGAPARHYPGIHGNVDTSRFAGSLDDLRALIAHRHDTDPAPAPSLDDGPPSVPTDPATPTSKSSQTLRAVNAPIIDADDGRAVTPLRAPPANDPDDPEAA